MTDQAASQYRSAGRAREASGWAVGFILFAAIMMIMAGTFQALAGLVAIFENEFYVATRNYLFQFDATTWGWIHLLVGLIVVMAGFAMLAGRTWGRMVGITLAMVSALANFLCSPYYPFWSLTIIAATSPPDRDPLLGRGRVGPAFGHHPLHEVQDGLLLRGAPTNSGADHRSVPAWEVCHVMGGTCESSSRPGPGVQAAGSLAGKARSAQCESPVG